MMKASSVELRMAEALEMLSAMVSEDISKQQWLAAAGLLPLLRYLMHTSASRQQQQQHSAEDAATPPNSSWGDDVQPARLEGRDVAARRDQDWQMLSNDCSLLLLQRQVARLLSMLAALPGEHLAELQGGDWHTWLTSAAASQDCRLASYATRVLLHLAAASHRRHPQPPQPSSKAAGASTSPSTVVFRDGVHLLDPHNRHHWALLNSTAAAAAHPSSSASTPAPPSSTPSVVGGPTAACEPPAFDIVFIHGIQGGPFVTWRFPDTAAKPPQAQQVAELDGAVQLADALTAGSIVTPAAVAALQGPAGAAAASSVGEASPAAAAAAAAGAAAANGVVESGRMPYSTTVGLTRSSLWPTAWLPTDVPGARLLSLEYLAPITGWHGESLPLELTVRSMMEQLTAAGVGQRPVVWVAHSMGGLLVKEMLAEALEEGPGGAHYGLLESTRGCAFYATPHYGSSLAGMIWKLRHVPGALPAPCLARLAPGPHLARLNDVLRQLHDSGKVQVLSFVEGQATHLSGYIPKILIVPPESADPGFGSSVVLPHDDHISVCKPSSREAPAYSVLWAWLQQLAPKDATKPTTDATAAAAVTGHDAAGK